MEETMETIETNPMGYQHYQKRENKRRKIMRTHGSICYTESNEEVQKISRSSDLFSKFLYRDNITNHRYEVEDLKQKSATRRIRTLGNAARISRTSKNKDFYRKQLQLLNNIKEKRNNDLLEQFRQISNKRKKNHGNQLSVLSHPELDKLNRSLRKQVYNINKTFLREYLYQEQPFNELITEINKCSRSSIINEKKIDDLKNKIQINLLKSKDRKIERVEKRIPTRIAFETKLKKQRINKKVDQDFQKIWENIQQQIGQKVRMEADFNMNMR